ncbi:PP2C family serine/threonine-protein phosphatase [Candidatus Protochlamydia phocaeensis]|uniref:PP2C family serine/threonine-protein phosphatase n=1 Tax=Candidatus Protochlamydia phocaeensis TaxID=1414722 RepID=UPI000838486A|nr:PP2C family protein-serine/threonine phosphatase [Candidatus Protochlamydia phocaeensis]
MFTEISFSYSDIERNCSEIISQYTKEKETRDSSKEEKIIFVASSRFRESYELQLQGNQMTFRVNGALSSENLQSASQLIQHVVAFAAICGLTDADSKGKTDESCLVEAEKKKKRTTSSTDFSEEGVDVKKSNSLLTPTVARDKRRRNLEKTFNNHGKVYNAGLLFPSRPPRSLSFQLTIASHQGTRDYMEDAGTIKDEKTGLLAAVFDGHCDQGRLSQYAADAFKKEFLTAIEKEPDQISYLFHHFMDRIHREIGSLRLKGGTTAAICYLDKTTNYLYTSTLGDSQAIVFRKQGHAITWFPVSCVRDWSSPKDAKRAVEGLKLYSFKYPYASTIDYPTYLDIGSWTSAKNPKLLRFPPNRFGINVSRSLGDYNNINNWPPIEILSHKPKTTEFLLNADGESEECIVIGTDGIWDYVDMDELSEKVMLPHWGQADLAQRIVTLAVELPTDSEESRDNATAICIHVSPQTKE